jgi:sec-independent protein translocase protein TatA
MFRNGLEPWHIMVVVLVFVLLFGYKRLPDAARGLGKSLRILKSETRALREEHPESDRDASAGPTTTANRTEALAPNDQPPTATQATPTRDERHTA